MLNRKKVLLLSFATSDLIRSVERFKKQAIDSQYYDQVHIASPDDLQIKYKKKINQLISKQKKRGYAYWYWKPLILLDIFKRMKDDDIVQYMDIGFHINKNASSRFYKYLNLLKKNDRWLLAFQYKPIKYKISSEFLFPEREEFKYTKADLFDYYKKLNDKKVTHTPQFSAGNFFIKKTENAKIFLNKWLEIYEKRFDLIDDTPSKINNFQNFIENRHDQSVFSILCKINFIKSLSAYEYDWVEKNNKKTWEHINDFPFFARRDLQYSIFKRFLKRQIKNMKRQSFLLKKSVNITYLFLKKIYKKYYILKLSLKASLREKKIIKIYYEDNFIHKWDGGALVSPTPIKNPIKETQMSLNLFTKYYFPREKDIIIDVGAGIGTELNFFSKNVGPKGKVICIEPDPTAFNCLRKLCEIQKINNSLLINDAVGEKKKLGYLSQEYCAGINNHIEKKNNTNIKVTINTLDDIIKKLNLKKISYLKINVEGFEINTLKGLKKNYHLVENFCISCHDFIGIKTYQRIKKILKKLKLSVMTNEKNINKPWEEFYLYAKKN
jgi:FkbM family methyltransferase